MDPFQIKFGNFHRFNSSKTTYLNFRFPGNGCSTLRKAKEISGKWMLNPQEDGRLDAKRHYVI